MEMSPATTAWTKISSLNFIKTNRILVHALMRADMVLPRNEDPHLHRPQKSQNRGPLLHHPPQAEVPVQGKPPSLQAESGSSIVPRVPATKGPAEGTIDGKKV